MIKPDYKIKIAFILWTLVGMGGSEKVVYDIVRKLNKQHYSILIISFNDGPVRALYENLDIKVNVITKEKRNVIRFIYDIKRILSDEAIDIVNPHHFGPLLYVFIATRFSNMKLVYTEHSRWQLEQLGPLFQIMNRIMLWKSEAVVAISKQIQDYYLRTLKLSTKKVYLIPNGIDIELYKNNRDLRRSLGIGEHEKVIGMVANLRPEKNHKLLISAFSTVTSILKDVKLLLIGLDCMDGEVQRFAAQSSASDRIYFLGRREDIPELLNILDILCLPSIYEGLPLAYWRQWQPVSLLSEQMCWE